MTRHSDESVGTVLNITDQSVRKYDPLTRDQFLADYDLLRDCGLGRAQIAKRLGMSLAAVEQRLSRYGHVRFNSDELAVWRRLTSILSHADTFVTFDLPEASSAEARQSVLKYAERAGLIAEGEKVRHPADTSAGNVTRYRVIREPAAAAA